MTRLEIKSCNMIFTEKHKKYQHYNVKMINIIDKYECLTGKEMPPSFEEQIRTIENQGEKLTKAIEVHARQLN